MYVHHAYAKNNFYKLIKQIVHQKNEHDHNRKTTAIGIQEVPYYTF